MSFPTTHPTTHPATFPATLPAAILQTILARLATLFLIGAAGDIAAAHEAAAHMLAAYHPETEDELRLAANIIGFSFQGLEALAQAAAPDIPITRVLRLRGGAVSLSRVSAKAEHRLAELQKSRRQAEQAAPAEIQPEPAQPEPAQPEAEIGKTLALIADTPRMAATDKKLTWTQAYQQRQRDARIAASLERAQLRVAAQASAAAQSALPGQQTPASQAV